MKGSFSSPVTVHAIKINLLRISKKLTEENCYRESIIMIQLNSVGIRVLFHFSMVKYYQFKQLSSDIPGPG